MVKHTVQEFFYDGTFEDYTIHGPDVHQNYALHKIYFLPINVRKEKKKFELLKSKTIRFLPPSNYESNKHAFYFYSKEMAMSIAEHGKCILDEMLKNLENKAQEMGYTIIKR